MCRIRLDAREERREVLPSEVRRMVRVSLSFPAFGAAGWPNSSSRRRIFTAFRVAQIFKQVAAGVDRAIASAKRLRKLLAESGADSPSTAMDQLVEQLIRMRRGS